MNTLHIESELSNKLLKQQKSLHFSGYIVSQLLDYRTHV